MGIVWPYIFGNGDRSMAAKQTPQTDFAKQFSNLIKGIIE
jgi:hypothetical protein